eukprot:jgi/Galph1/492/GphlegSOOS_G5175.1
MWCRVFQRSFRTVVGSGRDKSLISDIKHKTNNPGGSLTFDVSAIDRLFTPPSSTGTSNRIIAPNKPKEYVFSMEQLMACRVHLGHRADKWNPKMGPYILGERNGLHIINLEHTWTHLRRALRVIRELVAVTGFVLWLPPRREELAAVVRKIADRGDASVLDGRWVPGTLTNPLASGQAKKFGYKLPDMLFCLDCRYQAVALREAKLTGLPTVGIVDTDCDPSVVTYPIPGNDESVLAISLYCQLVAHAMGEGRSLGKGKIETKPIRRESLNSSRILTPNLSSEFIGKKK